MNKILHVRSTIGMYGAEKVVLNLLGAFSKLNVWAAVAVIEGMNPQAKKLSEELTKVNLPHTSLASSKRFDLNVIWKLRKQIKEDSITIVHTHDYKSLLLSRVATLSLNVNVIHHIHGSLGNTFSEKLYGVVERVCMYSVSKVITVSEEQRQQYASSPRIFRKIVKVNNGTRLPDSFGRPSSDAPFTVVMVARFTPEKNHALAVDILESLINKKKKIRFVFLGDGPCLEYIESKVNEKKLAPYVQFIGFTDRVPYWLESADLMLITSVTEGMPMCLLEAMAMGIPAVSTPVGEIPSLLQAANCGELGKTKEDLTSAIIKIMDDSILHDKYSLNGRHYVEENLSVSRQATMLNKIYSEKIGDSHERCRT
jgi:glycosyltransferase involved in cell wall biosynthesis